MKRPIFALPSPEIEEEVEEIREILSYPLKTSTNSTQRAPAEKWAERRLIEAYFWSGKSHQINGDDGAVLSPVLGGRHHVHPAADGGVVGRGDECFDVFTGDWKVK